MERMMAHTLERPVDDANLQKLREDYDSLKREYAAIWRDVDTLKRRNIYFSGHYTAWQEKRVTHVMDHFGRGWFGGKRVLELACGYGDIGSYFEMLGADVTYSDARQEHLDFIKASKPNAKTIRANLENEWPFEGHFDLILHFGVLYHLENVWFSLQKSLQNATHLALETLVSDSEDENAHYLVTEDPRTGDTAYTGTAAHLSGPHIEKILRSNGASFEMVRDDRMNSTIHCYDWPVTNSGHTLGGQRRFWYVTCPSAGSAA
jgi:SAM-dependent methyltransferase